MGIKKNFAKKIFLQKFFFSSLNMYQANSGVKKFPLYWGEGGGVPWQKFFFPVWTCMKPNLVSKIFPFTGVGEGGSPPEKVAQNELKHILVLEFLRSDDLWGGGVSLCEIQTYV